MERILLDIYSGVGDPDGIYAVAQSGDITSQLRLTQHEGDASTQVSGQYLMHTLQQVPTWSATACWRTDGGCVVQRLISRGFG